MQLGFQAARGDVVVTMDADLQDPPKDLIEMYKIISRRFSGDKFRVIDVVQAYRIDRKSDSLFKRTSASFYYKVIEKVTANPSLHTRDLGGKAMMTEVTQAVCAGIERS